MCKQATTGGNNPYSRPRPAPRCAAGHAQRQPSVHEPAQAWHCTADSNSMWQYLSVFAYGFFALLGAAVLVAGWEHLRRATTRPAVPQPTPHFTAHVDLDLAALDALGPAGDQQQRQATTASAFGRAAKAPTAEAPDADVPTGWTETRPMVAPGLNTQTEPH